jgi:hypothetical protein
VAVQVASVAEAAEAHQEAVEVGLDEGEGGAATMRDLHLKLLVSSFSFLSLNTRSGNYSLYDGRFFEVCVCVVTAICMRPIASSIALQLRFIVVMTCYNLTLIMLIALLLVAMQNWAYSCTHARARWCAS